MDKTITNSLEQQAYERVLHGNGRWHAIMAMAERGAIRAALHETAGNQTEAARLLGITRTTLRERLGRYDLIGYGRSAASASAEN
ncbi:MAG: helix-turn-helix domain-containing protein [Thiothrix sp.]|nr:helix-turn-helix domain-containing protein [Thiothrix sp.]